MGEFDEEEGGERTESEYERQARYRKRHSGRVRAMWARYRKRHAALVRARALLAMKRLRARRLAERPRVVIYRKHCSSCGKWDESTRRLLCLRCFNGG